MPRNSDYDYDDISIKRQGSSHGLLIAVILMVVAGLGLCGCGACGLGLFFLLRDDFTNSTWTGAEQLPGFGPLTFEFKEKNVAIMRDARGVVNGTWSKQGSSVTVRFRDCEYRGTVQGKSMTGTAHPNAMILNGGRPWAFNVRRQ